MDHRFLIKQGTFPPLPLYSKVYRWGPARLLIKIFCMRWFYGCTPWEAPQGTRGCGALQCHGNNCWNGPHFETCGCEKLSNLNNIPQNIFPYWFNGSNTNHEESTPSDWSVRWRCLCWIPLADPSPLQSPDGFRQSRWTSCLCNVKTRHILSRKRWKERYMHSEVSKHNSIYYASPFKPHIYIYWPWLKDKKRRMPFHGMKETICNSWWFNWPEHQKGIRERERERQRDFRKILSAIICTESFYVQ